MKKKNYSDYTFSGDFDLKIFILGAVIFTIGIFVLAFYNFNNLFQTELENYDKHIEIREIMESSFEDFQNNKITREELSELNKEGYYELKKQTENFDKYSTGRIMAKSKRQSLEVIQSMRLNHLTILTDFTKGFIDDKEKTTDEVLLYAIPKRMEKFYEQNYYAMVSLGKEEPINQSDYPVGGETPEVSGAPVEIKSIDDLTPEMREGMSPEMLEALSKSLKENKNP